ncbi:ketopantoate reductase family protein [Halobacterium hubeiense]|uniref:ketopantoate reductase family protein n=1 Tax=Halobacterium hubeiense TaxID=1407499 RepID=UPI003C70C2D1
MLADDVAIEIWRKFALICAQAGMTATTRLPIGEIRATDASWTMYRGLIEGVCAVARAEGVDVPDDTVEEWLEFAQDFDPELYSSLHYDLTHGKQLELDALHGAVVRHADEVDVAVLMHEAVHAILKPHAAHRD